MAEERNPWRTYSDEEFNDLVAEQPKRLQPWHVAAVVVLLGLLIVIGGSLTPRPGTSGKFIGKAAAGVSGTTAQGQKIDLSQYAGRVVVLDFWATWCGPCVEKVPDLIALQDEYRSSGVQVVGISLDHEAESLTDFEREAGINYPSILGGAEEISDRYGIESIPTIMVIDQKGIIRYFGYPTNVEREVKTLL